MSDGETTPGFEALRLARACGRTGSVIHVTANEARAEAVATFLAALLPEATVLHVPAWDCLPFDAASPSPLAMGRRMAALRLLAGAKRAVAVVAPAAALQRVPPAKASETLRLAVGDAVAAEAIEAWAEAHGYFDDERIDEPGEVAVRGEVIDVFPPQEAAPLRFELKDGRIESIRRFDPATQRSTGDVEAVTLDPASELPPGADAGERGAEHRLAEAWDELPTLFERLPEARVVATAEALAVAEATLAHLGEAAEEAGRAAPGGLYLTREAWAAVAKKAEPLDLAGEAALPVFAARARPRQALRAFLAEAEEAGQRTLLVAAERRDAARLATAAGREADAVSGWEDVAAAKPGALLALRADLPRGFVDAEAGIAVIAARDVLGLRAGGGRAAAAPGLWQVEAAELHLGDVVVDEAHGLAILEGLDVLPTGGEAIRLRFAKDEVLLVPAQEAGRLWRYGGEAGQVKLDRLDGASWDKRRAKLSLALVETAKALVAQAQVRAATVAPKLAPPSAPYERFVARFPFALTPDQASAVRAVLGDLASERPMNRLVIGDVGFGKTEIALRAAAATVLAGRQAIIVAPTTVLARQHAETFARRFAAIGIEVGHLSRLTGAGEAKRVRAGLVDGSLRLAVGTHALLGQAVRFAEPGLVVIDEEQRFGTAQKRQLEAASEGLHVLSMTATPIPRTLQGALVGLREISVLTTPPANRRPVRTFVAPQEDRSLRQALLRERRRGGQSFVVVPRVEMIEATAARLRALVPELAVRIAHGQMPAAEIDREMVGFAGGEGDVLLATSIIESGLDVPRANTMIVLEPEMFGLAQLHQLRGRVGRGPLQAYCYLASHPDTPLSEAAERRLGSLAALDRLGAGLAISARDLDLRGGGELFGEAQKGHVKLIGVPLYQALLAGALREAAGEAAAAAPPDLLGDGAGSIPEDYIPEGEIRLNLYARLARVDDPAALGALADEIDDRFGTPPPEARALLDAAALRVTAARLGIVRISIGPEAVALDFYKPAEAQAALAAAAADLGATEWSGERLLRRGPPEDAAERLRFALELVEALA